MSDEEYLISKGFTLISIEELSNCLKFQNRDKSEFMLAWTERIGNYRNYYFVDKKPPFNMYVERHLIC